MAAITGYQRHISPHKGFACAHRILYGGDSCSQYIKRVIAEEGLKTAFVKSRTRFQACKQANHVLRSSMADGTPTQTENPDFEEEEEIDNEPVNKQPRKPAPKFACQDSLDAISCGGDFVDASCNCAELVSMTPDCGALDCGGADCSALDCGGADCSFLDCGSCGN
jgi:putative component of membrane protein insertase Oxa1/YidC/SpoIIIJ protein YidD